jgi:hypothetical protein
MTMREQHAAEFKSINSSAAILRAVFALTNLMFADV